jgi:hypothetical protein
MAARQSDPPGSRRTHSSAYSRLPYFFPRVTGERRSAPRYLAAQARYVDSGYTRLIKRNARGMHRRYTLSTRLTPVFRIFSRLRSSSRTADPIPHGYAKFLHWTGKNYRRRPSILFFTAFHYTSQDPIYWKILGTGWKVRVCAILPVFACTKTPFAQRLQTFF